MSIQAQSNPIHEHGQSGSSITHSKDRALTEREFELLLEGGRALSDSSYYYSPDPELVIYALGRLGLRRGELAHLQEDWIDWHEQQIRIPAHSPCTEGEDDTPCGSCRQSARQRVEYADELTFEEALGWMWAPKTEAGARDVYFGHDTRAALILERYFENDSYDSFGASGTAISRRVDKAAELATELSSDDVHPHGLRATAASFLAGRGMGQYQLMNHFGWVQPDTALNYISRSSVKTARQLESMSSL